MDRTREGRSKNLGSLSGVNQDRRKWVHLRQRIFYQRSAGRDEREKRRWPSPGHRKQGHRSASNWRSGSCTLLLGSRPTAALSRSSVEVGSGRSSGSWTSYSRAFPGLSVQWLYAVSLPVTAAGPPPICAGFPFQPSRAPELDAINDAEDGFVKRCPEFIDPRPVGNENRPRRGHAAVRVPEDSSRTAAPRFTMLEAPAILIATSITATDLVSNVVCT